MSLVNFIWKNKRDLVPIYGVYSSFRKDTKANKDYTEFGVDSIYKAFRHEEPTRCDLIKLEILKKNKRNYSFWSKAVSLLNVGEIVGSFYMIKGML